MLRRVALVRSDVSEELSPSFIGVTRIGELGTTLAVTSNRRTLSISSQRRSVASYSYRCSYFTYFCHPDNGGAKFLLNVRSYKSHTA
jgi:hypothetical protein